MRVKQHFEKGVHVAAFHLIFLRHGHANDFAVVNVGKFKGVAFAYGTKDLCDVRGAETLQIIPNGFTDTTHLFGRLIQLAVDEMVTQLDSSLGLVTLGQGMRTSRIQIVTSTRFAQRNGRGREGERADRKPVERANRVLVTAIAVCRRAIWTIKMAIDKYLASQPV